MYWNGFLEDLAKDLVKINKNKSCIEIYYQTPPASTFSLINKNKSCIEITWISVVHINCGNYTQKQELYWNWWITTPPIILDSDKQKQELYWNTLTSSFVKGRPQINKNKMNNRLLILIWIVWKYYEMLYYFEKYSKIEQ